MTNRHTRRDGMRVDDQVWNNALSSERQIFLSVKHTDSTLLAVSAGKLVPDLWNALRPHLDLGESLALLVHCENDLVNLTRLRVLQAC